jgi:serine protease
MSTVHTAAEPSRTSSRSPSDKRFRKTILKVVLFGLLCFGLGVAVILVQLSQNLRFRAYQSNAPVIAADERMRTLANGAYVPGELIVSYKTGVNISEQKTVVLKTTGTTPAITQSLENALRVSRVEKLGTSEQTDNLVVVRVEDQADPTLLARLYEQDPTVAYAEPNYLLQAYGHVNDPYYGGSNPEGFYQWNLAMTKAAEAWDLTPGGSAGVTVAVVDTGVAFENYQQFVVAPELAGVDFVAPRHISSIDYSPDCTTEIPRPVPLRNEHPNDDDGHGTHVASTIAQATNNAAHAAGIAYRTSVMPIKVLHRCDSGSLADIVEGIDWAITHDADVINLSLGMAVVNDQGVSTYSQALRNIIIAAKQAGIVVVAASGNDADRAASPPIGFPAAFPETIAVGAVRVDGVRADYSQYASYTNTQATPPIQNRGLDVVAPGGQMINDQRTGFMDGNGDQLPDGILAQTIKPSNPAQFTAVTNVNPQFSLRCILVLPNGSVTYDADNCGLYSGTSMAAPHVSALAALLIAVSDTQVPPTPEAIREIIKGSAFKPAGYNFAEYGSGIISHYEALVDMTGGSVPTVTPTQTPSVTPKPTIAPPTNPTATVLPTQPPGACVPQLLAPELAVVATPVTELVWSPCPSKPYPQWLVNIYGNGIQTQFRHSSRRFILGTVHSYQSGKLYQWRVAYCLNKTCTERGSWSEPRSFYWLSSDNGVTDFQSKVN